MSPNLFFVLCAPKSGTTWLREILNAHPNIHCHSEGGFYRFQPDLWDIIRKYNATLALKKTSFGQGMLPMTDTEAIRLLRSFILIRMGSSLPKGKQLVWIGEKDPGHTPNLHLTMQMFPSAAYIHIIRDGRDQCVSAWHHLGRTATDEFHKRGHNDLAKFVAESGPQWSNGIRHVRKVAAEMPQARYCEVRYEAMVSAPDKSAEDLFSFLGVNTDDAVVASCVDAGKFEKLSGGRKPGNEDRSSFFRKGVVGDWRNYFDDAMARSFSETTGGLLQELGYE